MRVSLFVQVVTIFWNASLTWQNSIQWRVCLPLIVLFIILWNLVTPVQLPADLRCSQPHGEGKQSKWTLWSWLRGKGNRLCPSPSTTSSVTQECCKQTARVSHEKWRDPWVTDPTFAVRTTDMVGGQQWNLLSQYRRGNWWRANGLSTFLLCATDV